jgi:hypothetical protein
MRELKKLWVNTMRKTCSFRAVRANSGQLAACQRFACHKASQMQNLLNLPLCLPQQMIHRETRWLTVQRQARLMLTDHYCLTDHVDVSKRRFGCSRCHLCARPQSVANGVDLLRGHPGLRLAGQPAAGVPQDLEVGPSDPDQVDLPVPAILDHLGGRGKSRHLLQRCANQHMCPSSVRCPGSSSDRRQNHLAKLLLFVAVSVPHVAVVSTDLCSPIVIAYQLLLVIRCVAIWNGSRVLLCTFIAILIGETTCDCPLHQP